MTPTDKTSMLKSWGLLTVFALMSASCAGPSTPLGAVWTVTPPEKVELATSNAEKEQSSQPDDEEEEDTMVAKLFAPKIRFTPDRQVLHDRSNFEIIIEDPKGFTEQRKIMVVYNGVDVTFSFLNQVRENYVSNPPTLTLTATDTRFQAHEENRIEILYRRSTLERGYYAAYLPPTCDPTAQTPVSSTAPFDPPQELLAKIHQIAKEHGVNPSYVTGLIAQESGFNSRAVSWAKAIGLTQITPLAEEEIIEHHPEWPRYPRLNNKKLWTLQWLIRTGKANATNEWRLNPETAIRGSLTYMNEIKDYWRRPENYERILENFDDIELGLTQVMLASYNSGPARVKYAIDRRGKKWLEVKQLREAKKYVNRIFSYCHHFSEQDSAKEPEKAPAPNTNLKAKQEIAHEGKTKNI